MVMQGRVSEVLTPMQQDGLLGYGALILFCLVMVFSLFVFHGREKEAIMQLSWHGALPYFPKHELACQGCGVVHLDIRFAAALPALRQAWGAPLTPTSVCRTPSHNTAVGGHPRSLHLTGNPYHPTNGCMAADFAWPDDKLAFARLAWQMGWSVGLHDSFIHVDRRADIGLQKRVFLYGEWSAPFDREDIF